jgi:serine/threonine protein phosphatase 1
MCFLRRFSNSLLGARPSPEGQPNARAYAIGDVHGRLDLLDRLLAKIEADARKRSEKKTYVVFLGDLIDRGPDSATVVERLRTYAPDFATPVFIVGNHEEVLLRALDGEASILRDWLQFGGAECVLSYGLDPEQLSELEPAEAIVRLRGAVPRSHVDFIGRFADTFRFGDYLFVHAGIRPGIELLDQDQFDLRWIREPFLSNDEQHGVVVVHGHTIVRQVDERANRICIDTGAYHSGVLTAVAIEGADRWYLTASDDDGQSAFETAA